MVLTREDVVAWYELQRQEEAGKTWDEHAQLDGTVSGATLSNDAPSSKFIGSHDFDGTNDYVALPDNLADSNTQGTVSAWFKSDTLSSSNSILNVGSTSSTQPSWELYHGTGGEIWIVFRTDSGTGLFFMDTNTTFSTGTWHHVAVTSDGSTLKVYVDGVEQAVTVGSGTNSGQWFNDLGTTYTHTYTIGARRSTSNSKFMDGHICGVNILNKALTSTEIATLYNSGDGITYREQFPLSDNLEAYYKLDGDATDATGNGNNGTVSGATSTTDSKIGTAYSFDGTNDYIDTPTLTLGSTIGFGCWFKADNASRQENIFGKRTDIGDDIYIRKESGNTIRCIYVDRTSGTTSIDINTTTTVANNVWYHVFVTYDTSVGLRLFLNGKLEATGATTGLSVENSILTFGRATTAGGGSSYFDGRIDEGLVFTRTPTPGEIRRLYSFGAALRYEDLDNTSPLIDGVVAAYNFDGDVLDAKNNTYDGTNNGTTDVAGVVDRGRSFDGTNDYVNAPFNSIQNLTQGTISMWIYPDSTGNTTVWGSGDEGSSNRFFYAVSRMGGTGTDNDRLQLVYFNTAWVYEIYTPEDSLVINSWNNVLFTSNGTTTSISINGVEQSLTVSNGSNNGGWFGDLTALDNLNLGVLRYSTGGGTTTNYFSGEQDIPTIWGRALSSTEWNAFYNGGSGTQFPFVTADGEVIRRPISFGVGL